MSRDRDATQAVMVALRRIVRHLRLADREAEAAAGISAAQLFVLSTLAHEPKLSLGELAERTLTDQSSVSTVVAKLVARRLVVRAPSKADRRRAELSVTAAGAKLARSAPPLPQAQIIAAVKAMPAARRVRLVRSLDELVVAIGADATAARMIFED
jgi:DNA-binding MarR family transcriptional regulator